jgi:hypothetical protein
MASEWSTADRGSCDGLIIGNMKYLFVYDLRAEHIAHLILGIIWKDLGL